jgi:hypothetical protein
MLDPEVAVAAERTILDLLTRGRVAPAPSPGVLGA